MLVEKKSSGVAKAGLATGTVRCKYVRRSEEYRAL